MVGIVGLIGLIGLIGGAGAVGTADVAGLICGACGTGLAASAPAVSPGSAGSANRTVSGSAGSGQTASACRVTGSPDRIAVPTAASCDPGSTRRPMSAPNESRAGVAQASLAVVTTAVAPSAAATRPARSLAPPACPPTRATAHRRASSTQTTPGSLSLPVSRLSASSRTVAPVARKQTTPARSATAAVSASRAVPS